MFVFFVEKQVKDILKVKSFSNQRISKIYNYNFLFTTTITIRTEIRKTSGPFNHIEAYNLYIDQTQKKLHEDDVVFTE